jgi:hypothetical protein
MPRELPAWVSFLNPPYSSMPAWVSFVDPPYGSRVTP